MKTHCGTCGVMREVSWYSSVVDNKITLGHLAEIEVMPLSPVEELKWFCTVDCLWKKVNAWALATAERIRLAQLNKT